MEYNNAYLDDQELPHINQEQGHNGVDNQQFDEQPMLAVQERAPPLTTLHPIVDEEELLAAQAAADAAVAQQQAQPQPGGVFGNVGQGLTGKNRDLLMQYWQETIDSIENDDHDFKNHQLPLARIKKVMKTDEEVRMISAEAPILFAKGCDVFITELTMRAWIHAEENKRRTLQKSDIAAALTKSDMFDFLIDVVPREEEKPKKSFPGQSRTGSYVTTSSQPPMHHLPQPPMGVNLIRGTANPQGPPQNAVPMGQNTHLPGSQGLPLQNVPHLPQTRLPQLPNRSTDNKELPQQVPPLDDMGAPRDDGVKQEENEESSSYNFDNYQPYENNY
ncbi:hypothetical protein C7M61_000667 [Candidozyma pseudohaemuli]|uniref:Core Histone H2A/H2B/H3 domain-containing protein n=1 Tax=Candidozyma pseudohaemuli TaxID=418784 RepID=A0A2P7YYG9_9ASCO|nr:hypothetical protein C7M61_000667 [[Candida] pseudohaemulonii]PSK41000.1 hypothetical protein C7M61_000667 [[Candida] pseudohaemulonii]